MSQWCWGRWTWRRWWWVASSTFQARADCVCPFRSSPVCGRSDLRRPPASLPLTPIHRHFPLAWTPTLRTCTHTHTHTLTHTSPTHPPTHPTPPHPHPPTKTTYPPTQTHPDPPTHRHTETHTHTHTVRHTHVVTSPPFALVARQPPSPPSLLQGTMLAIDSVRGKHDYANTVAAAGIAYAPLHFWAPMRANKWWAAILVGLDLYHEWQAENEAVPQGPGW